MSNIVDLTGRRFDKLVVVGRNGSQNHKSTWNVVCDCGTKLVVTAGNLQSGNTSKCRHCASGNLQHGYCGTRIYRQWKNIKSRCLNVNNPRFNDYGGRGIKVCDRWLTFENFLEDSKSFPGEGDTIDRINNDGNYEPGNCRWATRTQQGRNTRRVIFTENDIPVIRALLAVGEASPVILAKHYDCSVSSIYEIKHNRIWKDL